MTKQVHGSIRLTYPTAMVLQALDAGYRYGFDIAQVAGLRPGSVYQILHRLEEAGLAHGAWEDASIGRDEGRPSRRYYRLADAAAALVVTVRGRYPALTSVPGADPATGRGA